MKSPRRRRGALALALALTACGSNPFRNPRATLVSREQRVTSRHADADAYFAAVYGHQRALGGVDRRRAELFASVARALALPENVDRLTLTLALRAALERASSPRVTVRFDESALDVAEGAWHAALTAPTPAGEDMADALDARHRDLVERVELHYEPAAPPPLAPVFEALGALHRDAVATRRCMARLSGPVAPPLTHGAALLEARPDLAAELRAAELVVLGVRARATRHEQEAVRLERWIVDTLAPPEEGAEPAPASP